MKRFYTQDNVGHIKYLVNYHDGVKKHLDGSDFFDLKTFRNKTKRNKFTHDLCKAGYKEQIGGSL